MDEFTLPPIPRLDEYNLRERLEASLQELMNLLEERRRTAMRIGTLQADLVHLAALCRVDVPDPVAQLGLTGVVRWIISNSTFPQMSANAIAAVLISKKTNEPVYKPIRLRDIVAEARKYPELAKLENLPANVHTVVRRLEKAGEIEESKEFFGQVDPTAGPSFVWKGGLPPLPPNLDDWLQILEQKLKSK